MAIVTCNIFLTFWEVFLNTYSCEQKKLRTFWNFFFHDHIFVSFWDSDEKLVSLEREDLELWHDVFGLFLISSILKIWIRVLIQFWLCELSLVFISYHSYHFLNKNRNIWWEKSKMSSLKWYQFFIWVSKTYWDMSMTKTVPKGVTFFCPQL